MIQTPPVGSFRIFCRLPGVQGEMLLARIAPCPGLPDSVCSASVETGESVQPFRQRRERVKKTRTNTQGKRRSPFCGGIFSTRSKLCDDLGFQPTVLSLWRQEFFENGTILIPISWGGNLLWRWMTECVVAKQPLRNRRAGKIWLPIVDAFRTRVACPPPAVRAVFQQIQSLTGG